MPRSLDVILRHEVVDQAKPGDKVVFTGCLVVVPDVAQLFGGVHHSFILRCWLRNAVQTHYPLSLPRFFSIFDDSWVALSCVGVDWLAAGTQGVRSSRSEPGNAGGEGVSGIKALGVRELTYRLAFMACSVQPAHSKVVCTSGAM
jgi:DNA replication licensing factor MCM6